jgi:hypothetical protein
VSPLIQSNRPTEACYVIDSQIAARLADCVNRAETYAASQKQEIEWKGGKRGLTGAGKHGLYFSRPQTATEGRDQP